MMLTIVLLFSLTTIIVNSVCPGLLKSTPINNTDIISIPSISAYNTALATLDIKAVFKDIYDLLTDSQTCWPADTINGVTHYGGLMIRLTWHCSGTFRDTDGKGGCAGGRIRFSPEASWDDNTNLDKARALLVPIKEKYGDALSWGDLFVFAGTASILNMDGPVTNVCAGRIDDTDNINSLPLDNRTQCPDQGNCPRPLGASTVGLIYVNPEGIKGVPIPENSTERIRDVFGRMGMNDSETVALIGGGHAFGKSHGACPLGAGKPPIEMPMDPWNSMCNDTFTSGFEGQWTTNPFKWDNEYFTQLINDNYTLIKSPANKNQWRNEKNGYLMLTTDLSLIKDIKYKQIVMDFANDINKLNIAFSNAWEKLTTSGGSFAANKKCMSGADLKAALSMTSTTTDAMTSTTTNAMPTTTANNAGRLGMFICILVIGFQLFF